MDQFPDFSLVGQKGAQHQRDPQVVDRLLPVLKFMPVDQSQLQKRKMEPHGQSPWFPRNTHKGRTSRTRGPIHPRVEPLPAGRQAWSSWFGTNDLRIFLLPVLHYLFPSSPARIMNIDNMIHKGGDRLENFSYQFLLII
jgi:hypothetical protein